MARAPWLSFLGFGKLMAVSVLILVFVVILPPLDYNFVCQVKFYFFNRVRMVISDVVLGTIWDIKEAT